MTEFRKHKTLEEILENTESDGDCMIWQGGKHRQGYGMMRQRGEMRTVHSVIAELVYGYKPDKYHGERVVRTCDNNLCVSPDHVIIEQSANLTRKRYHCKTRLLTQEQVREIRKKYAEGSWGIGSRLAKEYNVSSYVIYATVSNRLYKELPDET
jgi:hypothetical protein